MASNKIPNPRQRCIRYGRELVHARLVFWALGFSGQKSLTVGLPGSILLLSCVDFEPSIDRKPVMDTVITAESASTFCQNICHCTSIAFEPICETESRTIAVMFMIMLRERKTPRRVFWPSLIFTFQRRKTGIPITEK